MIHNRKGYIQDVVLTRVVNHISSPSLSHLLQATLLHSEVHIFRFIIQFLHRVYLLIKNTLSLWSMASDNLFLLLTAAVVGTALVE